MRLKEEGQKNGLGQSDRSIGGSKTATSAYLVIEKLKGSHEDTHEGVLDSSTFQIMKL